MDLLDYHTDEEPGGADFLLVSWPGLRFGGVSPGLTLDRLRRFRAHKLNIGADAYTYVGPRRSMQGARASLEIVRAEMERLGVPRENVITYGPSMRAVCALWMGLEAGVGRVICGGVPVRLGSRLRRLDQVTGPSPEAAAVRDQFLALAEADPPAPPADVFFDELIYDAASKVTEPTTVHLFVSREDEMFPDNRELAAALSPHPHIDCRLDIGDYGMHGNIKDAFKRYLTRTLREAGVPRSRPSRQGAAAAP